MKLQENEAEMVMAHIIDFLTTMLKECRRGWSIVSTTISKKEVISNERVEKSKSNDCTISLRRTKQIKPLMIIVTLVTRHFYD